MKLKTFSELVGQTLTAVESRNNDELIFTLSTGERYKLYHEQDCCEDVQIEDIAGDLNDLVGSTILMAEEVVHGGVTPEGVNIPDNHDDSFTWTFYKLATVKGYVTIRWFGTSNGYYSERVDWKAV